MLKQLIILLALSLGIMLATPYAQQAVHWLLEGHHWVSQILSNVFAGGSSGNIVKGFLALLCIPFLLGLVPAMLYWILRRHWLPCFMSIVWVVWLIQAGALLALTTNTLS